METRTRSLPIPRRVSPSVAGAGAGVAGVVALAVTLTVTLRPEAEAAKPDATAVAGAQALRAEAALRNEQRASRDRTVLPATPTATPTVAKTPALTVVGKLWVTSDVNVRSGPSATQKRIGSLPALTQVPVTAANQAGWIQVVLDGRGGWVKATYLSRSKPKPQPVSTGVSGASCSISADVEQHLTANARSVYRAVCSAFGDEVSSFGGYRAGDDGDHGTGRAVDIMISGDPGLDVARYVQAHAGELHVTYVIYQQRIWMAGDPFSQWKTMEDRGSRTANHFDHVHVSVS